MESVRVALQALRANVLRSVLTALGIIIGVAAVITMVALGSGAQRAVSEQITALGANVLNVVPGQSMFRGVASASRVSLTTDDAEALAQDCRLLAAVVPEMQGNLQVKLGAQNINTTVLGTTANFLGVRNYTVAHGRSFTDGDDAARRRYALLGASVPDLLGANAASLIGQSVLIQGTPFEVIGVLARKGSQGPFMNPDEQITIPLQTARYRVFGSNRLRTIAAQVAAGATVEQGMIDIERVLRRKHRIRLGGDNDFTIMSPLQLLETQETAAGILTTLLASIAGVSLLVGGIGIMNIMLVSVTERTHEIGLRKAVGATRRKILVQFLVEAVALAFAGGMLGIAVGVGGTIVLRQVLRWNMYVSISAVAVSFAFSAAVGLFFGIWPARRAARLDPIDALRHE
jgi:putative ABC transport system permease protein